MAGYGGQMVALNAETPYELQSGLADVQARQAQAATARTNSQLAAATLQDNIDQSGDRTQASALSLANARKASLAKNTGTDQELIANAAALAQTPEEWDEAMQGLADNGVPAARQFVGRYSEQMKGRVTNAYSASSPSSALTAMQSDNPTGAAGAESGLTSVVGGAGAGVTNGAQVTDFDRQFAGATPQQLQMAFDHHEKIRAAIQEISQAPNPQVAAQLWDRAAQDLGQPQMVGKYSPQALQQLAQQTTPLDNYLRGRMTQAGLGVPAPKIPAKIDNVGGVLYRVDESDPSHPVATPLTPQGKGTLVGVDPKTGVGVYYDPVTGKETRGSIPLGSKPSVGAGGRGGNSVFALKQAAWLQVHPGDTQGALDYAGSLKGKQLSAEQIQMAATTQASREYATVANSAAMSGQAVPDAEGWITSRTAEISRDIGARANTPTGAPAAPAAPARSTAGPPASALAVLQEGKQTTFSNGQVWTRKNGKPVRIK